MRPLQLVALFLCAVWASAQVTTVQNAAGATVAEVITTNALGNSVTSILSTFQTSSTSNPLLSTQTTKTTTTTTSVAQGVNEQPPAEPVSPGGPTPYEYTTTNAAGNPTVVQGIFTPTVPPTVLPSPTTTGTIIDYSSWVAIIGTNTVAANAASHVSLSIATGWYCFVVMAVASLASGTWFVIS
ncbi:hypothetical protein SCLCIDRAFT_641071 [Scleroderma citrinum Foug A]|uniref:Uncharacterized protein n=1 Tax=Scleroderma citrinum Foug A TaxID=1036808 RepID=A0A0C3E752_9AGAM|nr:hypothetical protein SCLCIDRAFT_641071 [Scleroderma citrinum Foug A]